ncbi:hypothetical protein H9Q72_008452 [Fusarium xylarioides]|uniref:Uncharacterized protein n=1 Tax=Fusarium xylarioides TaxID=221167 RepID=A0A9P7HTR3_9HYPO|nr:hypothetical protein H9Q70_005565 [Fusarium xylarioides]KAG5763462.1 hypothetical protein H9Q72_008452 [Fusarium xylarioides]KAG5783797.1 hypothetical protein H9Q73_002528 [Fusarium xylarioides]
MSPFANRGELLQHLTREHQSDALDYDQLSMIAGQSQGIKERSNDECLLCGFVIETECQKGVPSQRQNESRREGKMKKRKTKRDQFNPTVAFSSSSDEEDRCYEANNHESMTHHIAAHLQTLMFLTLRVLEMQKDMGSENEDVAGSNIGTVDNRDYQDSQYLDDPLSFEDESSQSELIWLPAVEAYSFNFDRQQHQVLRYPVLEREDIINTSIESPDSSTIQETILRLEALLATTQQNQDFHNSTIRALESTRHRNSSRPSYYSGGNSGSVSLWQCVSY